MHIHFFGHQLRQWLNHLQREMGNLKLRSGALLLEALLGIALFGLFATASFLTLLTGQESARTGSARVRGVYYTEQAIEIAKIIRDQDFDLLTAGQHGFTLTDSGSWALTGSLTERHGYSTYLLISDVDTNVKRIVSRSIWKFGYNRSGATLLTAELTDWRDGTYIRDWTSGLTETGSISFAPSSPLLNDIVVDGNYAYVTSDTTDGSGVYVIDISDPTNPFITSNYKFVLGGEAHKPVVYDEVLYLIVEDGAGTELKGFSIADPTDAFSGTTTVYLGSTSYNLPGGNNRGVSMARQGTGLYVGAAQDGGQDEFYAFDITNSGTITLLDSHNVGATVNDVYIQGNYAYLATDSDTQELYVMNISDPSNLALERAVSLTSTEDGTAVRMSGTGFHVGRSSGASDDFALITGSGGLPSTTVSDQYGAEMGASVNALDIDPLSCFAFLATDLGSQELQIHRADTTALTDVGGIDLTTGNARGVYYDHLTDLLYIATNQAFHIYSPGSNTGTCLP